MVWKNFVNQASQCLEEIGLEVKKGDLEEPPREVDADLAFPCFGLEDDPTESSRELREKIEVQNKDLIEKAEAKGPYLNFYLDMNSFAGQIFSKVKEDYGSSNLGKGKKVLLEHTSVNPSGPLHVGRIRNSVIGDSLARILEFSGYDVLTQYYVNDIGKQCAMIKYGKENLEPEEELVEKYSGWKNKEDFELMFYYVAANRHLKEDNKAMEEVEEMLRKCESGDVDLLEELREQAKYCLKGQKEVFEELGVDFDEFFFESQLVQDGKVAELIKRLEETEYATKSEGALALDLSTFSKGRDEAIIRKEDGTSVYLARDLAYHLEKAKRADKLMTVLGEDHEIEGNELKIILQEILDVKNEIRPLFYSFVNFEGVELSTRKGQTAPVDELIEEAKEKAEEEIEKREFSEATEELARKIGVGAVKYHIARTDLKKPIKFSWDEALSFEGDAAPYIQYTHARASSILEKSQGKNLTDFEPVTEKEEEKKLLNIISKFPSVVEESARKLRPHIIANYCWKASEIFNKFYQKCPVIQSEGDLRKTRLHLVKAYGQTIQNALNLLGIQAPEKM